MNIHLKLTAAAATTATATTTATMTKSSSDTVLHMNWLAPPVKNWRFLLQPSYTVRMPLLIATRAFGLETCQKSLQWCCLHRLHTVHHRSDLEVRFKYH